jgi:hypothetical protein
MCIYIYIYIYIYITVRVRVRVCVCVFTINSLLKKTLKRCFSQYHGLLYNLRFYSIDF